MAIEAQISGDTETQDRLISLASAVIYAWAEVPNWTRNRSQGSEVLSQVTQHYLAKGMSIGEVQTTMVAARDALLDQALGTEESYEAALKESVDAQRAYSQDPSPTTEKRMIHAMAQSFRASDRRNLQGQSDGRGGSASEGLQTNPIGAGGPGRLIVAVRYTALGVAKRLRVSDGGAGRPTMARNCSPRGDRPALPGPCWRRMALDRRLSGKHVARFGAWCSQASCAIRAIHPACSGDGRCCVDLRHHLSLARGAAIGLCSPTTPGWQSGSDALGSV